MLEPWATPEDKERKADSGWLGIATAWVRWERKDWNQEMELLEKDNDFSLLKRMEWLMELKALEKSRSIRTVNFLSSIAD